jgi:hypothetical protein
MPDQLAYLHFVSLTLINALKRLPDLYIQDFDVRRTVPLTRLKSSGCGIPGGQVTAS